MPNRKNGVASQLEMRIRRFSKVEKSFWGAIVLTIVVLAVSIVFMQTKLLRVEQDLTDVNVKIEEKKTELDDAKQEVNELVRSDRLNKIANDQEMQKNNQNVRTVE